MKKIKKQSINKYLEPIDVEIDLHGFTKTEAIQELMVFLKDCASCEYERVRIITGKGLHSKNGEGVLKNCVEDFLNENNYRFSNAKINEGGDGAIIVYLDWYRSIFFWENTYSKNWKKLNYYIYRYKKYHQK